MVSISAEGEGRPPIFIRLWGRLPVFLRALVAGMVVFLILQLGQAVMALNLVWRPDIPWITPAVLLFLYLGWRYFAGRGWPNATRGSRATNMRVGQASFGRLAVGMLAAIFTLLFMVGLAIVNTSLIQFPDASFEPPGFLGELPALSAFTYVLLFSLVAAVSEEAGFRGYMQVPLEKRYGTPIAVAIIALLFWLAHFESASFLHRFPMLFGAGLIAGFLAAYSRSLWPPIFVHFAADTIGFTTVARLFGSSPLYTEETIWETGITPLFVQALGLMALTGLIVLALLVRLSRMKD